MALGLTSAQSADPLDGVLKSNYNDLKNRVAELEAQMGDDASPFPNAGVDAFLSHFILAIEFTQGEKRGQYTSITMPVAVQTVARSSPFTYVGTDANHTLSLPTPLHSELSRVISEGDFLVRPAKFFEKGKEVVWMQILNLDARAETHMGRFRIILGETLKREHPDLFLPSLGMAQSLGTSGFPARLFFNPVAVMETPFGVFRAIHGTLSYGRVTQFPPVGAAVHIEGPIALQPIEEVRRLTKREISRIHHGAQIIALAHPIDTPMFTGPDDAFGYVEQGMGV